MVHADLEVVCPRLSTDLAYSFLVRVYFQEGVVDRLRKRWCTRCRCFVTRRGSRYLELQ